MNKVIGHIALRLSLGAVLLLFSCTYVRAQNNPYKIDDECYELYREANSQGSFETRIAAAEKFRKLAIEKGDRKAETISYSLDFVSYTRYFPNDRALLDAAARRLRESALETGYDQYYFFSYSQAVVSYLQRERYIDALEQAELMLSDAVKMDSKFGYWTCYRSFANIYLQRKDFRNARHYLGLALDYADKLPDQSVSRIYSDLASTYTFSSDSSVFYLQKALDRAITAVDTNMAYMSLAKTYGLRQELDRFKEYDKLFAESSKRNSLQGYTRADEIALKVLEDFLDGNYSSALTRLGSIKGQAEFRSTVLDLIAERTGDYQMAWQEARSLNDSLRAAMSRISSSDIANMAERLQNDLLQDEVVKQSLLLSRRTVSLVILLVFLLVVILAMLAFYNVSKNKNTKRLIRLSKALKETRDEAVKANSMKTQFIQNMSHEIRTPLNAIVGFSQLLGLPDGLISEDEKHQYTEYIRSNSDMLTMLVDDILNLADMEHGHFRVELRQESVNLICRRAMNTVQYRVPPGVNLRFTTDCEDSQMIGTDDRRVMQVLINFLTNACKHTEKGEIHLVCSTSENPGKFTLSVSDTGTGVPEEMAEKIFERFVKLNSFKQGTGLGLHICRQIATRLGGTVTLDKSYKGGARFVFVVPNNN